ncbi:MAG: hypothetical protein LIQ31_07485, partial [Planctomycetes bacterium]|nr:hypothetical protein [Planctomycetota bacterium]
YQDGDSMARKALSFSTGPARHLAKKVEKNHIPIGFRDEDASVFVLSAARLSGGIQAHYKSMLFISFHQVKGNPRTKTGYFTHR